MYNTASALDLKFLRLSGILVMNFKSKNRTRMIELASVPFFNSEVRARVGRNDLRTSKSGH